MLKELEDFTWFPSILRRWQMDFIGSLAVWTNLYQPLVAVLEQMISKHHARSLQDNCSGSGLPALYMHQLMSHKIPLLLTDQFPPQQFNCNTGVVYAAHTTDLLKISPSKDTVYTLFNSFHHFSDEQQKGIIKKFSDNKAPFLIGEILEPGIATGIKIFLTTTLGQIIMAPFIRPFSPARLFFTYIIPVNLITVTYDGIISVIKSKTARQYHQQLVEISTPSYLIAVHKLNNWKGNLVYIKGEPINS